MDAAAAALTGNLDEFPIPSLLRFIAGSHQTGTLILAGNEPTIVCFDAGAVALAGPADVDQLRTGLVSAGVVSETGWKAAMARARGGPLAAALVESGASLPAALTDALYEQTVNTVFELLLPSRTRFWFEPVVHHPLGRGHHFDPEAVLADAARRLQTWQLIADVIPSTSVVVRLADQLPMRTELVTLSREEWPVLASIDGRRDVAAIITATGLSAFGVCGVLHRFISLGIGQIIGRQTG
jgi:hypothetical protein